MPKAKLYIVPKDLPQRPQAPNNLPVKLAPLVGRETELEAVRRLLSGAALSTVRDPEQEAHVRLLTLVGPGGVGKTRLALRVAEELLNEFEEGVYFVDLTSVAEVALVVPTIAMALQVQEAPGTPLLSTLTTHLQARKILLVLDNFEQLLSARSDLAELLAACPRLKLLVTSRAPLGLPAEEAFELSPLALPDAPAIRGHRLDAAELLQYGAIELFAQRASTLQAEFELTDENADAVVEICRRVDGLPLAIELVAAHARLLSPQSILSRLSHPLRLLTKGPQDAPGRHRTMRDTIEWSYKLLDEQEQRLFRRLSVFVSGFDVRVAEAVCNEAGDIAIEADDPRAIEILAGLESLVDKNLLRQLEPTKQGDRRLGMLETVREYALEQLVASGEAQDIRRRLANYYLSILPQAHKALTGEELTMWMPWLDKEHDNLRAALNWLLEQEKAETARSVLHLLIDLENFWNGHASRQESQRWLERALAQIGDEVTPLQVEALIKGSIYTRKYIGKRGDYSEPKYWAERALAMARQLGDKRLITEALGAMSIVELVQGNYPAARSLMEENLAVYRELGDEDQIAGTLNDIGEVARYQGDYETAEAFVRQSVGLFRAIGNKVSIMVTVSSLAQATHRLGKLEEASALYLEVLTLAQEIKAPMLAALALSGLAGLTLDQIDRPPEAGNPQSAIRNQKLRKKQSVLQAARLCGLAAGLLERSNRKLEDIDEAEFDNNVATIRAHLSAEAFAKAWEQGRAMTLDKALQLATQEQSQEPRTQRVPGARGRPKKRGIGDLTTREYEVAGLVAHGLSNEQIALRLVLSERTIETYVSDTLHKLGLATRTQLAAWAVEQGLT